VASVVASSAAASSPRSSVSRVYPEMSEAYGRRAVYPTVQTCPFQRALHVLHRALAPCVLLLPVVDGQQGLLHEGGHPGPDLGLGREHLGLRHSSLEQRLLDLGPIPIRLGLDDPAEALPVGAEQSLDHLRLDPGGELQLDRGHGRQLVFADVILGLWFGEAVSLPDDKEEVQGHARPFAQLTERRPAHPREPIEGGRVQVGERECSVPDGGG
jgi:hypothetical protein